MPERQHANWGELLREAVEKPGRMLQAYTAVHIFVRERFACGGTVRAAQPATRTTQYLQRMARTKTAGP